MASLVAQAQRAFFPQQATSTSSQQLHSYQQQQELFPIERLLVTIIVSICRVTCFVALYIFEAFVARLSASGLYDALQHNNNSSKKLHHPNSSNNITEAVKSSGRVLSTADHNNRSQEEQQQNNSSNNNRSSKKASLVATSNDDAACMADMIATAVLPYYLASECTTAMAPPPPPPPTRSSSSSSSSPHSDDDHHHQQQHHHTTDNVTQEALLAAAQRKRIKVGDEGSLYKVLRVDNPGRVDGIILIVGSSASDDVDAGGNAPVLGHIALQLADHCSVVGSLAVVACRVDFLRRPEPLSAAMDRLELLVGEICTNAFPQARGPLLIMARNVTATLALHVVVRAARCATPPNFFPPTTTASSSPTAAHYNNVSPPALRHAAVLLFSPFVGWNTTVPKPSSSTGHSSSARSSDEMNTITSGDGGEFHSATPGMDASLTPQWNTPSHNNPNYNNNDGGGGDQINSSRRQRNLGGRLPSTDSFDTAEFLERFEEASFMPGTSVGGGGGGGGVEPHDYSHNDTNNGQRVLFSGGDEVEPSSHRFQQQDPNNDNPTSSNNQHQRADNVNKGIFSKITRLVKGLFTFNQGGGDDAAMKYNNQSSSQPQQNPRQQQQGASSSPKWNSLFSWRLFQCRLRIIGSATWTRMQDIAHTIFSPSLGEWFPATAITFLYPSIRAMIVTDSAAPYSVETLHWARKLVSQGCGVRVVEWNSASKDPYSEFTARVTDTEGTAWLRDLLIEAGVLNNKSCFAAAGGGRGSSSTAQQQLRVVESAISSEGGGAGGAANNGVNSRANAGFYFAPDEETAENDNDQHQHQHQHQPDDVNSHWETQTNEFSVGSSRFRNKNATTTTAMMPAASNSAEHQHQRQSTTVKNNIRILFQQPTPDRPANHQTAMTDTAAHPSSAFESGSFLTSPPQRDLTMEPTSSEQQDDKDDNDDTKNNNNNNKNATMSIGGAAMLEGSTKMTHLVTTTDAAKNGDRGANRLLRSASRESADLWSLHGSDIGGGQSGQLDLSRNIPH